MTVTSPTLLCFQFEYLDKLLLERLLSSITTIAVGNYALQLPVNRLQVGCRLEVRTDSNQAGQSEWRSGMIKCLSPLKSWV
jgi:hypothetical protein